MTLNPLSFFTWACTAESFLFKISLKAPPLPTDVVHVHAGGRKLETLVIQDLSRMKHLYTRCCI